MAASWGSVCVPAGSVIVTAVPLIVAVTGDRPVSGANSVASTPNGSVGAEYVVLGNLRLVGDDLSVVYPDSSPA